MPCLRPQLAGRRILAVGDRPLPDIDMRLHVDLDPEPRRLADQQARRSDPALAEMKVVADGDAADAEPLDQIMVNKILCGGAGAALVERHYHSTGKPGSSQQAQLSGLVRQPELGRIRAEKTARMRLEGHRKCRPVMQSRHFERGSNDSTMSEMDAIEIAHGDHGAFGNRGCRRGIADDGKAGRHYGFVHSVGAGRNRDVEAPAKSSRANSPVPDAWAAPSANRVNGLFNREC